SSHDSDRDLPPVVVLIQSDAARTRTYLLGPPGCTLGRAWEAVDQALKRIPGRANDEKRRDLLRDMLEEAGFRSCGAVTSRIKHEAGGWRATGPNDPEEEPGVFVVNWEARLYLARPRGVPWHKVLA